MPLCGTNLCGKTGMLSHNLRNIDFGGFLFCFLIQSVLFRHLCLKRTFIIVLKTSQVSSELL